MIGNILAKIEASNSGYMEALMLDAQGYVAECTGDNIFILKNNIFDKILRFDIATVLYESNNYKIEYLKNAFQEL